MKFPFAIVGGKNVILSSPPWAYIPLIPCYLHKSTLFTKNTLFSKYSLISSSYKCTLTRVRWNKRTVNFAFAKTIRRQCSMTSREDSNSRGKSIIIFYVTKTTLQSSFSGERNSRMFQTNTSLIWITTECCGNMNNISAAAARSAKLLPSSIMGDGTERSRHEMFTRPYIIHR